jgi:L-seryl-tRNA(Ser) seleniumtransferase
VLREVGTTNRTRAADYAAAVTDRTALILRVHQSNFRIEGFTARPVLGELVDVGRRLLVPVAEDLGSGSLLDCAGSEFSGLTGEPTVRESVSAGADVVFFSGDKLLGGPQSGIIVGRGEAVERIRKHPLMRALRVDKLTYAALEATLAAYAQGRAGGVPVVRMLGASLESIDARARALAARLGDRFETDVVDGASAIGGGSAPGVTLPTRLVAMTPRGASADWLESQLRRLTPPVIARIERDRVLLDLRTVAPQDDEELAALLDLVKW